jgi:hypothetical protein
MTPLNSLGRRLAETLTWAQQQSLQRKIDYSQDTMLHVASAGKTLTSAYEQLRNAAEYVEENLLLQRAIGRFYRRTFLSRDERAINESAEELVLELTLAGYLGNDSIPLSLLPLINSVVQEYYKAYNELPGEFRGRANAWIVDVLAVTVEGLLSDHNRRDGFVQFAYDYFHQALNPEELFGPEASDDYALSLFIAVNRTLIKADAAMIRTGLLTRYAIAPSSGQGFIALNQRIDALIESHTTEKLMRIIERRGGSLRVLWRMIDTRDDIATLLASTPTFLNGYEAQIRAEYERVSQRIKQGIIKSIAFLIITKVIIGLVIEIPYDKVVHGEILWLPLAINLLFPPVYMIALSLMLPMPGPANTQALTRNIERLLYGEQPAKILLSRGKKRFGAAFSVVYALLFLAVFGGATWLLINLDFSLLHLAIFFVFLSTASFLGFRLTRMVREIEVVEGDQNALTITRDVLYMPFVVVGHWISDKYGRMNIMTLILDMAIELPLKTILYLIRQWAAYITSKKDEL